MQTLEAYIQQEEFLVRDVIRLGLDVLSDLQTRHARGIFHCNINADSIFVSADKRYVIGEHGVSKGLDNHTTDERPNDSSRFLPPENYLGIEYYTCSADLYSLGLVLYKLLNYSRSPFIPPCPQQYSEQDERDALALRMSGKIPPPPALGGEEVGRVILKAISGRDERFQTAQSFISSLEAAVQKTAAEELDRNILFSTLAYVVFPATPRSESHESVADQLTTDRQSVFMDTVPDESPLDIEHHEVVKRVPMRESPAEESDPSLSQPQPDMDGSPLSEKESEPAPPPNTDLKRGVRPPLFGGKWLNRKSKNTSPTPILTKREPYLQIQAVNAILRPVKLSRKSKQLNSLADAVKRLEEKLMVESDFGKGKEAVILCENQIAQELQFLKNRSANVEIGDFEENLQAMHESVLHINALLRERIELKRR